MRRETWKAIPGQFGYEASDLGRVRSIDKKLKLRNRWGGYDWRVYRGRVLKQVPSCKGRYLRVKLGEHCNGFDVHTLIALAFLGPRPYGKLVMHIDDNGHNNSLRTRNSQKQKDENGVGGNLRRFTNGNSRR